MVRRDEHDEYDNPGGDRGPVRQTSKLAVASLILGVLSLCMCLLTGLPALICGGIGLMQISSSKGRLGGGGMAVAGLLLGLLGSCAGTGGWGYFGYTAFQAADSRRLAGNNLKQIGLAMHNYHDANAQMPPAAAPSPDFGGAPIGPNANRPAVSWRVLLLPYLEQDNLYRTYRMDEPWDGPNNKRLLDSMPNVYASGKKRPGQTTTPFQVFVGPGTIFEPKARVSIANIPDGSSNTVLVAEAADEVPWTKPDDIPFTPNGPRPKLGQPGNNGFLVVMGDGLVLQVPKTVSDQTLEKAIDRRDGLVLGPDWPR